MLPQGFQLPLPPPPPQAVLVPLPPGQPTLPNGPPTGPPAHHYWLPLPPGPTPAPPAGAQGRPQQQFIYGPPGQYSAQFHYGPAPGNLQAAAPAGVGEPRAVRGTIDPTEQIKRVSDKVFGPNQGQVFAGTSGGPLSVLNSWALFQDKVSKVLGATDGAALPLPRDTQNQTGTSHRRPALDACHISVGSSCDTSLAIPCAHTTNLRHTGPSPRRKSTGHFV